MRKMIIALLLTVVFGLSANAQALKDGSYSSRIIIGEKYLDAYFTVKNGEVYQDTVDPKLEKTTHNDKTTTYTWMNNGGVWNENQTYVFTLDSKTKLLYVTMIRVVQNQDGEPWSYSGVGYVHKN